MVLKQRPGRDEREPHTDLGGSQSQEERKARDMVKSGMSNAEKVSVGRVAQAGEKAWR